MAEQQNELLQLPVIPLPGVVAFPKIPIQFEINDDRSFSKMYDDMEQGGLQPVLNDYIYV